MSKRVAPPKLTSGGGFVFENDVAAYFLSCLLGDQPPLSPDLGLLTRIDFQTRADGWLLDDLLLTLASQGTPRRCPFSVKSNRQFTSKSAPREFVAAAWEQLLHEGTGIFDTDRDSLGIITCPLPTTLSESIQRLIGAASKQDSEQLTHRSIVKGFMSTPEARLYSSFACPDNLKEKHPEDRTHTGELLKRLIHLEFDFERQTSTRHQEAVKNCRDVLQSNSLDDAVQLWEELRRIGMGHRSRAGFIDFRVLVDILRHKFRLKNFPEHQLDWERLLEGTRSSLAVIPDRIGNVVSIPRQDDCCRLREQLAANRAVVIRGPSGCGKTVLTKLWAEEVLSRSKVLWWEGRSLEGSDFSTFEAHLALKNALRDVLRCTTDSDALLVIDGIDRVFSEQPFRNLAVLIQYAELHLETSPWRLLITVQPEEWDRIQMQLASVNVSTARWDVIDVTTPSDVDLAPVWKAFPSLGQLRLQHHLRALVLKPKVLDLLATRLNVANLDTSKWVGESDLIKWFWEIEVLDKADGATRAAFLKLLAERQGDDLRPETPSGFFPISDQASVSGLVRDRICRLRDEKLSFDHDLYGDWARQRILLSNAESLRAYLLHRMTSPLWHRALRLYSLHLLEQEPDLTRWQGLLVSFGSDDGRGTLEQDLILESAIFAANPDRILERLWPDLSGDRGVLLRRLLRRFHHTATLANPMMIAIAAVMGELSDTDAALTNRIPYWPYWLSMLRFLHNHLGDVIEIAMVQVAELANTWLRFAPGTWPLRTQAAEIALAVGERINRLKGQHPIVFFEDKIDESIYRAVLAGAGDLTTQVSEFALQASRRRHEEVEEDEGKPSGEQHPLGPYPSTVAARNRRGRVIVSTKTRMTEPWPDGPLGRIDRAFHKVCLDSDSLVPLINGNPSAAREVILANLIEEPEEYYEHYRHPTGFELDGFRYVPSWHPPFYIRGPFLQFLRAQPVEGLETIMRLVNFATERWSEEWTSQKCLPPCVLVRSVGEVRELKGDGDVYYWYRDSGNCPHSVVSALMSLEKWLYEEIDAQKNVESAIQVMLRGSNSVAFAGLLSAVGRKEPSLFQSVLQPLLAVEEFHFWEVDYGTQPLDYLMIGWAMQSNFFIKLAQDWHNMPHRRRSLHDWAVWLYLTKPEMRPFFEEARRSWLQRFENNPTEDYVSHRLEWLIPRFDVSSYKVPEGSESGSTWIYEPARELQEKYREESEISLQRLNLVQFPLQCKRVLDAGQPLSQEGIEELWAEVQHMAALSRADDSDERFSSIADAVTGGVALLVELHDDWLNQDPEKKEWCVNRLIETIINPPPPREFDSDRSIRNWSWDAFCARAIPTLWSQDPASRTMRGCIVELAMNKHYRTVDILCRSVAKRRALLGQHFGQLQNFLLSWASARWEISRHRRSEEGGFDLEGWLQCEAQSFINGTMRVELRGWSHPWLQSDDKDERIALIRHERYRRFPKVDLTLIQSAFSWFSSLAEAQNQTERSESICFWEEVLHVLMWTMGDAVENEAAIEGTPYEWDRWVLGNVAWIVQQLSDHEHPEGFWQPVLNLGSPGHYWVDDFLTKWFRIALRSNPVPEEALSQWKAMIDFAFSSPDWDLASPKPNYYISDLWCNLMGFSHVIHSLWGEEHRRTVEAMEPYYRRWASGFLHVPRCLSAFALFLKNRAADGLSLEGIVWIEASIASAARDFFDERDVQESLVILLDNCWLRQKADLQLRTDSFKAFMSILKKLADLQNPMALEVQQRVVSTG